MKKYVTILLALALVLAMGAVSLAGTLYPGPLRIGKLT